MAYSENGCYTIPGEITCIKEDAFRGCPSLTSITIPEGVTAIGNDAFNGTGLETITIPKNVAHIGAGVFLDCRNLASITVDPENKNFCSDDGVLFNKNKSLLVKYPPNRDDKTYVIPESVTHIGDHAFSDCWELASVTIPEGVTSIGDAAFGSSGLSSITIPKGVTHIGDYAFHGCKDLASLTIPESVTVIGDHAFYHCWQLISAAIPEGVTSIGSCAFNGTGLKKISIPKNVANIGERAFSDSSSLVSIIVDPENKQFCSDGGVLFSKDKSALLQYPAGKKDKTYTIPAGVTIIAGGAFDSCKNLREIKPHCE